MKISSLGKLTLGAATVAFVAGSAYANVGPNVTDSQGNPVKDAQGACVVSSGINHPDCNPKAPAAPAKPAEPAKPAAPAAPTAPSTPAARPAPASVKQAVVIQADALFDFD